MPLYSRCSRQLSVPGQMCQPGSCVLIALTRGLQFVSVQTVHWDPDHKQICCCGMVAHSICRTTVFQADHATCQESLQVHCLQVAAHGYMWYPCVCFTSCHKPYGVLSVKGTAKTRQPCSAASSAVRALSTASRQDVALPLLRCQIDTHWAEPYQRFPLRYLSHNSQQLRTTHSLRNLFLVVVCISTVLLLRYVHALVAAHPSTTFWGCCVHPALHSPPVTTEKGDSGCSLVKTDSAGTTPAQTALGMPRCLPSLLPLFIWMCSGITHSTCMPKHPLLLGVHLPQARRTIIRCASCVNQNPHQDGGDSVAPCSMQRCLESEGEPEAMVAHLTIIGCWQPQPNPCCCALDHPPLTCISVDSNVV